jgi:hypothetical protein
LILNLDVLMAPSKKARIRFFIEPNELSNIKIFKNQALPEITLREHADYNEKTL